MNIDTDFYPCSTTNSILLPLHNNQNLAPENEFVLKLSPGDKIDIYDEEYGYWEIATLYTVNPFTKSISFKITETPNINNNGLINYLWEGNIEDFEISRYKTHTFEYTQLSNTNPLNIIPETDSLILNVKQTEVNVNNLPLNIFNAHNYSYYKKYNEFKPNTNMNEHKCTNINKTYVINNNYNLNKGIKANKIIKSKKGIKSNKFVVESSMYDTLSLPSHFIGLG
eukprot:366431_1